MDQDCPACGRSLRDARMPEQEAPRASRREPRRFFKQCPYCQARLLDTRHPAFADDWRWMIFTAPGLVLAVLAIFVWPPVIWVALPALAIGLLATGVYTVRARMRWVRFKPFDEAPPR